MIVTYGRFGVYATMALLVNALLILGVMAVFTRHRREEFGVRLGLGALPHDVEGMVVLRGGLLVVGGIGFGLLAAVGSTGAMSTMLFNVQPVDVLLFSRQLHTLLRAGVPILQALAGLQESSPNERMKQTLQQVRQSLGSGIDLSMSLAQHSKVFDGFYVALVRVGEMTGRLEEVFLHLFHHIEFEMSMGQQIKSVSAFGSGGIGDGLDREPEHGHAFSAQ